MRRRTLGAMLVFLGIAACTDEHVTSPSDAFSAPGRLHSVVQADGFSFLPPLVESSGSDGTFNPDLAPHVEICELDLAGRDADLALASCDDPSPIRFEPDEVELDSGGGFYQVGWKTNGLTAGANYRVQVWVGATLLGYHDVHPVQTNQEVPNPQLPGLYVFRRGSTIPLKFQIDEGALCSYDGVVVIDCDESVVYLGEGGTVATDDGGVTFGPGSTVEGGPPAGGLIHVIVEQLDPTQVDCFQPGSGMAPLDIPQFGPCFRITTEPEIVLTEGSEAIVSLCIDLDFGGFPVTEAQEQLIQIHKVDEDTGEILALPNVQSPVCGQSQTGARDGDLPDNRLFRYASLGWRAVRDLVGPRPLTAADLGLGGMTRSFSQLRWALPATLRPVDGTDAQLAPVGTAVAQAPAVIVEDADGNPVEGATVRFSVRSGGGAVAAPVEVVPGTDGIAAAGAWTLGIDPGLNELDAGGLGYQPSLTGQSHHEEADVAEHVVTLTATAVGPPTSLVAVSGDGQTGEVGQPLAAPLVVRITDAAGTPVSGETVTWSVSAGSVDQATTITAADGTAGVTWTLGTAAGAQSALATVAAANGPAQIAFSATAEAGAPAGFGDGDGGDQGSATVAGDLPLSVTVEDAYGNPVDGVTVTWTVAGGGGSVGGTGSVESTTQPDGTTQVTWTLGTTAGANSVTATITVQGTAGPEEVSVTFTAAGLPGPAASLTTISGDGQSGAVATELSADLVVRVADSYGNAVAGHALSWSTASGSLGSSGPTNALGMASATWTLGTTAGPVTATASSGAGSATFSATAGPGPATQVVATGGDGQTAGPGQTLPNPIAVQVRDAFGNAVPATTVAWQATSGGGAIAPSSGATDAAGEAVASWTLGIGEGTNTATASVAGVGQVGFTALASCGGGGFGTATVDGSVGGAEWACARSESFVANVSGGSTPATVHWMNDGQNLYMAVVVQTSELNELLVDFDNDGDGVAEAGDDALAFGPAAGGLLDRYLTSQCTNNGQAGCGEDDTRAGGSADGVAAFTAPAGTTVYELSKPLVGDAGLDLALSPGDAAGFFVTLRTGNGAKGNTQWPGFRAYRSFTVEGGF